MQKTQFPIVMILLSLILSACVHKINDDTQPANSRTILKTMGNGLIGNSVSSLSPDDRQKAIEAEYRALEYSAAGKSVDWTSSQLGTSGIVTPGQPYQVGEQNCRQYTHLYTINFVPQTVRGSACRNANGSWSPLT